MRKLFALAVIAGFTMLGAGQPDLAGTWVCNMDKSSFGKTPKLQMLTLKVERKGGDLLHVIQTMDDGQGPKEYAMDWFMDGKMHPMDPKMTSMSKWDGNMVVADRKSDDGAFEEKIRITFSSDGKTATEHVSVKTPTTSNDSKLIWEKK